MRAAALLLALLGLALPASASAGAVGLHFSYSDGDGGTKRATLACDGKGPRATGYLRKRDAAKLCRAAYRLETFLASAPPKKRTCTEIYGGPDRARIRGFVRGSAVDRHFSRTDGCQIADWNHVQALLPRPADIR